MRENMMMGLMEEMSELLGRKDVNEQGLPPGFRFHPTDEELITFYLASKVYNGAFCGVDIAEVDLNRCEPWDLPDVAKMGDKEWYFFSLRDRKYPNGLRTNRATGAGYWKATGKDKEVYSASSGSLLGMKKTLVFYKGRAPRGQKTKWIMHEYRLDGDFSSYRHTCKDEWVICRIHNKTRDVKNSKYPAMQAHLGQLGEGHHSNFIACTLPPLLECHSQTTHDHNNNPSSTFLQNPNSYDLIQSRNQPLFHRPSSSSSAALQSLLFKSFLFPHIQNDQALKQCKEEEEAATTILNVASFDYLMENDQSHSNGQVVNDESSLLQYHLRNSLPFANNNLHYCYNGGAIVDGESASSASIGGFNKAGFQATFDHLNN